MKRVAFYCVNDIKEGSRTPLGSGREGKCPVDSYQPRVVRHLCRATGTQTERSGPLLPSSPPNKHDGFDTNHRAILLWKFHKNVI